MVNHLRMGIRNWHEKFIACGRNWGSSISVIGYRPYRLSEKFIACGRNWGSSISVIGYVHPYRGIGGWVPADFEVSA